jgi:hypothetical protein
MRMLILTTTVEEISDALPPNTDLRSWTFFRAVLEKLIEDGVLEVETDGIDIAVYAESGE